MAILTKIGLSGLQFAILAAVAIVFLVVDPREDLRAVASVFFAATSFAAMSVNLLLASRLGIVERAAGGLDKLFLHHRRLGHLAMAAALVHFLMPPSFPQFLANCGPTCRLALESGEFAFFALIGLGVLSVARRWKGVSKVMTYGRWKLTHYLFIGVWGLACFHLLENRKMPNSFQSIAEYLAAFGIICMIAYLAGHAQRWSKSKTYEVTQVDGAGSSLGLTAVPATAGSGINFKPGQFAFIRFTRKGLKEAHPFTLAAAPEENGAVRFQIKPSGDFTSALKQVEPGDQMIVQGGYGGFTDKGSANNQLWVAAGIGITPFLALAEALEATLGEGKSISLVHVVRSRAEAAGTERLQEIAARTKGFSFHLHETSEHGRWSPADLDEQPDKVLFCGPPMLRKALQSKFGRRVHFEFFEF